MDTRIRPYRDDDTAGVVALYEAAGSVDGVAHDVTPAGWRNFVKRDYNANGRDFLIAHEGDRLVGLTYGGPNGDGSRHFGILVHPDRRRSKIGSRLLASVDELSSAPAPLECVCPASRPDVIAFLERHGFERIDAELGLRFTPGAGPAPRPLRGRAYELRRATPEDAQAIAVLNNEALAELPGYARREAEGVRASMRGGASFLVAGDPAGPLDGFLQLERDGAELVVEVLAVRREKRRLGVGRALLDACLRTAEVPVSLSVDGSNVNARALYESAGFVEQSRSYRYRREP